MRKATSFSAPPIVRPRPEIVVQEILTCRWIKAGRNLIITGPSGIGKSWLACALADHACKQGHTALNHRVSRVAQELTIARADGSFIRFLERIAKMELLILDDWVTCDN
ncbi:ATP-binding protein [bacterium]|nr:ATP-binding protein [bacterium]